MKVRNANGYWKRALEIEIDGQVESLKYDSEINGMFAYYVSESDGRRYQIRSKEGWLSDINCVTGK